MYVVVHALHGALPLALLRRIGSNEKEERVVCRKWIGANRCDIEQLPAVRNSWEIADTLILAS